MRTRLILTTSCLLLHLLLPGTSLCQGWEKLPPLPEPNGGFATGVSGGRLLVIGGTRWQDGRKLWLPNVHAYDPTARAWTPCPALPYPLAYGLAGANAAGGLWLLGGHDGTSARSQAWLLADGQVNALPTPAGLPALCLAGGGTLGGRFIVVGGCADPATMAGASSQVFLVEENGRVTQGPPRPGPPILMPASAVVGGRLFLFGGAIWDAVEKKVGNTSAAAVFDLGSNRWQALRPLPAAIRGLTAVPLPDGRIYLAGGYLESTQDFTDSAWLYDVEKDALTAARPLPYRAMVGLALMHGHLYCIGGEDRKQSRTDAFFRIPVAALDP